MEPCEGKKRPTIGPGGTKSPGWWGKRMNEKEQWPDYPGLGGGANG